MSKSWIHIEFWFKKGNTWRTEKYLTIKEKRDFEKLLAKFIKKVKPARKFYLYEDIPHCFLALENVEFKKVKENLRILKRPYIYKITWELNSGDELNGEGFLNILNAFTDFYLFKRDNRITHIIHCCMEFMLQSRQSECAFYQNMAALYQIRKIRNEKIVYGYKKLTPKLREKLKKYVKQLDLRIKDGYSHN